MNWSVIDGCKQVIGGWSAHQFMNINSKTNVNTLIIRSSNTSSWNPPSCCRNAAGSSSYAPELWQTGAERRVMTSRRPRPHTGVTHRTTAEFVSIPDYSHKCVYRFFLKVKIIIRVTATFLVIIRHQIIPFTRNFSCYNKKNFSKNGTYLIKTNFPGYNEISWWVLYIVKTRRIQFLQSRWK